MKTEQSAMNTAMEQLDTAQGYRRVTGREVGNVGRRVLYGNDTEEMNTVLIERSVKM